jgi:hypothetical protein
MVALAILRGSETHFLFLGDVSGFNLIDNLMGSHDDGRSALALSR